MVQVVPRQSQTNIVPDKVGSWQVGKLLAALGTTGLPCHVFVTHDSILTEKLSSATIYGIIMPSRQSELLIQAPQKHHFLDPEQAFQPSLH